MALNMHTSTIIASLNNNHSVDESEKEMGHCPNDDEVELTDEAKMNDDLPHRMQNPQQRSITTIHDVSEGEGDASTAGELAFHRSDGTTGLGVIAADNAIDHRGDTPHANSGSCSEDVPAAQSHTTLNEPNLPHGSAPEVSAQDADVRTKAENETEEGAAKAENKAEVGTAKAENEAEVGAAKAKCDLPGADGQQVGSQHDNSRQYDQLKTAENRGSIEQLAEYRRTREPCKFDARRWTTDAVRAIIDRRAKEHPEKRDKKALMLNMSKRGATPGEWRTLKLFSSGQYIHPLYEARMGIKGAQTELPGIGRKRSKDLRQHLRQQVWNLYDKHGICRPAKYSIGSGEQDAEHIHCRECWEFGNPLFECIGQFPCVPCVEQGINCEPRQERDPGLGVEVTRKVAITHLRRPAPHE